MPKFSSDRPFADPDRAARKLIEIATPLNEPNLWGAKWQRA